MNAEGEALCDNQNSDFMIQDLLNSIHSKRTQDIYVAIGSKVKKIHEMLCVDG